MKLLLLLLLSFSAIAQQRILFKPIDTSIATQFLDAPTVDEAKEKAVNVLLISRAIKGSWVTDSTSLLQRTIWNIEGAEIQQGFDSTTHTFELKDITVETLAIQDMKLLNDAINCGKNVVKLITIRNSKKDLTSTQNLEILQTYGDSKSLMEAGAVESARDLMNTLTPDGVKITTDDKTYVISEIEKTFTA